MNILSENSEFQQDQIIFEKLESVGSHQILLHKIFSFYNSLKNDVNFITKICEERDIEETLLYLKDKVKYELEGPQLQLEIQEIAAETLKSPYEENTYDSSSNIIYSPKPQYDHLMARGSVSTMISSPSSDPQMQMMVDSGDCLDDDGQDFFSNKYYSSNDQPTSFVIIEPQNMFEYQSRSKQKRRDSYSHRCSSLLPKVDSVKNGLVKIIKHLAISAFIYYGLEQLQGQFLNYNISQKQLQNVEQNEDLSSQVLERFLSKSIELNSSKKLLSLLVENYSKKCQDVSLATQNSSQTDRSGNILMYLGVIFMMKGGKLFQKLTDLFRRYVRGGNSQLTDSQQ